MVAVKMGGPMPPMPMGGMPQPTNMLPPPMPVPPMQFGQQPVGALPAQAAGTAPVAPIMRSNAGRRKRFGDSLEGMLATTRPPPMVASDQMAGMNVFTGQMPRGQMMGGTAMQPPVRRMMGGGPVSVPRQTDIYGQPHMLAYINPEEADLLQGLGGMGTPGPGGVPQYNFFSDFFSAITGGGKSSNTGGRNEPRGSSSSSSQSYTNPSNDPYAEDRGGSSSRATNILDTPSKSTSDANRIAAESMIAGGGGTNLSGSGSTAMEKLLADQQAQTQKDSSSNQTAVGSGIDPGLKNIMDQAKKREQEYLDSLKSQAAAEAEMGLDIFGPDVTPTTNTGVVGGYDTLGIGSSDDPLYTPPPDFTIDDTPPSDITGSFPSTPVTGGGDDDSGVNLNPVFYDMFGNEYKTQAAASAADAEHLRKQQEAAAAESQRLALEEEARIQAEVAAREAKEQAERERIAKQAAAEAQMGLGPFGGTGGPDDPLYVSDVFETPDPMTMQESSFDYGADPIKTGLGDKSLDKAVTDATEETDDRNFIQKFIDDIKDVPGNIVNDITMALDAGLFGSYDKMIENLKNAKNPDGSRKYTDEQIDKYIADTKETQRKQREKQERESAQDDDDGPTSVVDPCPEGFKLDPASGICVPVEEDDTEEDEDSGDDKEEDTSDDELSGVVRTPPPPTSYLDNPIKMIDNPLRMNKGGSVGLNRAADNFLAAMGA